MLGYDNIVLALIFTAFSLSALLVYVSLGVFGLFVLPLIAVLFYILPGDVLKSMDTNGVRVALLLLNGMLVGWIPAEHLGNPPLDESGELIFTLGLMLFTFGFTSVFTGLYSLRRFYHISRTPTSDVASVDDGTVEVEGEIEPARETVTAPVSEEECVAYEYEATQTRRFGSRSYRSVVESERDSVPFYVDDGTGRVLVDPEGAEIDVEKRETEEVGAEYPEFDRDTTLREMRVPPEGRVYVHGTAEWSEEGGQVAIQDSDMQLFGGAPFFKISDSSESELIGRYKKLSLLSALTAVVGLPAGLWLSLGSSGVI